MAPKQPKPAEHSHVEGQLSFLDEHPAPAHPQPTAPEPVPETAPEPAPSTLPEGVPVTSPEPAGPAAVDETIITGPNTRVRAGNAMQRARAGAIRGAIETLARRGFSRLTMAETADRGGLARATLYNHVRDKDALLALLLDHEARAVADAFAVAPTLEQALIDAAGMIADHPAIVGLRTHEPAALIRLSVPNAGPARDLAAEALQARGLAAGDVQVDLLLRWLISFVASPSDPTARAAQATALARTLG